MSNGDLYATNATISGNVTANKVTVNGNVDLSFKLGNASLLNNPENDTLYFIYS
jgi:hypothetical protein